MKKHIVFILLVLFTIPAFSQQRGNIFNVPHWNTAFGITLPKNTFVYCSDSNKVYRLKASSTSIGSLLTILNEEYPNRSILPLYWDSINNVIFPYDTANAVAIGTNAVASGTMLRVNNGSVLFDGSTGTTPISGAGTRLMWIPEKAAFRAGSVDGTEWDDENIGLYSSAFGYNTTASGSASHAEGAYTTASGTHSNAEGEGAAASGYASHAEGGGATASGDYSHAEGGVTTASGHYSHAEGQYTTANSYILFASGRYNDTTLSTDKFYWVNTDPLFQIGNGTGTGANSNDALRILKNGTAYIGDASSTTDPILTVSTTDSTTSIIGEVGVTSLASGSSDITLIESDSTGVLDTIGTINIATDTISHLYTRMISTDTIISSSGAIQINYKFTLADDDSLSIPTGSGLGQIKVDSVGVKKAAIYNFTYDNTGTPDLVSKTANVAASNTDANFCAYKGVGAYVTFRNRLGYSVDCLMTILYYE